MESAALMIYLADKTGKLMPKEGEPRYRVLEWLMWQMGGPGPIFGQVPLLGNSTKAKGPIRERGFSRERGGSMAGLTRGPAAAESAADNYSIADIAIWPWVSRYEWQTIDLKEYPNVTRWYTTIAKRPAVQKGYKVPKDVGEIPIPV